MGVQGNAVEVGPRTGLAIRENFRQIYEIYPYYDRYDNDTDGRVTVVDISKKANIVRAIGPERNYRTTGALTETNRQDGGIDFRKRDRRGTI